MSFAVAGPVGNPFSNTSRLVIRTFALSARIQTSLNNSPVVIRSRVVLKPSESRVALTRSMPVSPIRMSVAVLSLVMIICSTRSRIVGTRPWSKVWSSPLPRR